MGWGCQVAGRRPLSAEESALWARVTATVRALGQSRAAMAVDASIEVPAVPQRQAASVPIAAPARRKAAIAPPADTLDGGWDRRLARGVVSPERTIDLHGHTLASAHDALDHALERAIADEVRVLLVVTGRPPRADAEGRKRGLIRGAIGDWLGSSRHANRIAAVRNAHPRHGGAGALYLVLRRRREER